MKSWDSIFSRRVAMIPEAGCWLFSGCWTGPGYGNIGFNGKNILAHRLSYMLLVGPLDAKTVLRHKCDTPACINPAHLIPGSFAENSADMVRRRRNQYGSARWNAKLDEQAVIEIRQSSGTDEEMALKYGVCRATVTYVRRGKTWKQVTASREAVEEILRKPE